MIKHRKLNFCYEIPQKTRLSVRRRFSRSIAPVTSDRTAFSVVELLVVIGVIGLLIALVLPAIQSVRESSHRATCGNNLRQMGIGVLVHYDLQGHMPTGGWGHEWVGLPGRGFGIGQPGGWMYNILPFVEYTDLHDLGANGDDAVLKSTSAQRLRTPIPLYTCPSRRTCAAWPTDTNLPHLRLPKLADEVLAVARSDYAINTGDQIPYYFPGPSSLSTVDSTAWPDTRLFSGICFLRSTIRISQIQDGTSHTYLIGEKYLNSENYFTGKDPGDNESLYVGYCADTHRFATKDWTPRRDRPGPINPFGFGSAHPDTCGFVFCDGSVRFIANNVDAQIHIRHANRMDGLANQSDF